MRIFTPCRCVCFWVLDIYLQDGEVFQHTVHHVFLWEVFELVYKVDHVLAQWRAMDSKHIAAILEACILRLERERSRDKQIERGRESGTKREQKVSQIIKNTSISTCILNMSCSMLHNAIQLQFHSLPKWHLSAIFEISAFRAASKIHNILYCYISVLIKTHCSVVVFHEAQCTHWHMSRVYNHTVSGV